MVLYCRGGIENTHEEKYQNRTFLSSGRFGNQMGLGEAQERGLGIPPQQLNRRGSLDRRARGGGFTERWCASACSRS